MSRIEEEEDEEYENTVMVRKMLANHDYDKIRKLEKENESLLKENESLLRQLNKSKENFKPYNKYILWQCHEYPYKTQGNQKPACGQWNIKKVKIGFGQSSNPYAHVRTFSCKCPGNKYPRRMSYHLPNKTYEFDSYEAAEEAQRRCNS